MKLVRPTRVCRSLSQLRRIQMIFASFAQWLKPSLPLPLVFIATILCAGISLGQAQSDAADLRGFVRDQQGAVVANATVTARNPANNSSHTATTNDEGFYQLLNLSPGLYHSTLEAP